MQFRYKPTPVPPDHVLFDYWGSDGFFRPTIEILLHGPTGASKEVALLDSGSPYIAFDLEVAEKIGVRGPFRRRVRARGVGGAEVTVVFPEDGEVQILLTDFVNDWSVWTPLVGFIKEDCPSGKRTGILGFTGFYHYFAVDFPDDLPTPTIDVTLKRSFTGRHGPGRPPRDVWELLKRG
jgi:hypothetical protein